MGLGPDREERPANEVLKFGAERHVGLVLLGGAQTNLYERITAAIPAVTRRTAPTPSRTFPTSCPRGVEK